MKKIIKITKQGKHIVVAAYLKGKELTQTFNEMCEFYGNNLIIEDMSRTEIYNYKKY